LSASTSGLSLFARAFVVSRARPGGARTVARRLASAPVPRVARLHGASRDITRIVRIVPRVRATSVVDPSARDAK
tara:strand:+ start:811 stop:1035 length:225 start_codon:yes stop_codon:yes gene_type:complete